MRPLLEMRASKSLWPHAGERNETTFKARQEDLELLGAILGSQRTHGGVRDGAARSDLRRQACQHPFPSEGGMRKRPAKRRLPDASNRLEGDNTLAVGRDGDVAVFVNARDFRLAHAGRCRVEHTSRCDPIRIVEQEASVCVGLLQGQFLELLLAVEL